MVQFLAILAKAAAAKEALGGGSKKGDGESRGKSAATPFELPKSVQKVLETSRALEARRREILAGLTPEIVQRGQAGINRLQDKLTPEVIQQLQGRADSLRRGLVGPTTQDQRDRLAQLRVFGGRGI